MNENNPNIRTPGPLPRSDEIAPFTGKDIFRKTKHNEIVAKLSKLLHIKWTPGKTWDVVYGDSNLLLVYPSTGLSDTSGGSAVKQMQMREHHADHLVCWDLTFDTPDSSKVYKVAKPPFLRYSIYDAVIDGNAVSFTYDTPDGSGIVIGSRDASFSTPFTTNQSEIIGRPYLVQDRIYAVQVPGGITVSELGGTIVCDWLDLNVDARVWMYQYGQQ